MEHLNKIIGKYKITRFIGEGGMATVYEGTHQKLGTKVAIKILNPVLTANKQIRLRFENEAKFMATLEHPNITRVLDFEEQSDMLAIVMELLHGQDLSSLIRTNGALSIQQALPLFSQILDAFQYAHKKDILHRDIKPSNIFINADNQVKILDFGIAKILSSGNELTSTGTQIGTPVYMSPEQVKADKNIDHRSDIYSLGVTLYYTLNGKPPYDTATQSNFEIFNKIVYEPIPDLLDKPQANQIIKKAVEKNPEQRYQNGNEFKEALMSLSAHRATEAYTDDKTKIDNNTPKNNIQSEPEHIIIDNTVIDIKDAVIAEDNTKIEENTKSGGNNENLNEKKKSNSNITFLLYALGIVILGVALFIFINNSKPTEEDLIAEQARIFDSIENEANRIKEETLREEQAILDSLQTVLINDSIAKAEKLNEVNSEWKNIITNTDLNNINKAIELVVKINNSIAPNAYDYGSSNKFSKLVQQEKMPIRTQELFDFKKVKSIQGESLGIFEYDYFGCKFIEKNEKMFFQKTTGSQRKSGYLYRRDDYSFVFLGGWSVNNDPLTSYKSQNSEAGILYKVSQNKLILIFANELGYEIYDIIK